MAQDDVVVDDEGNEVKEQDLAEGGEVLAEDENDSQSDSDSHSEDDDGDKEESPEDDENEREAKRQYNRQRRQEKKEAQREKTESLRRELAARDEIINRLQERVSIVERTHQGSEEAQIETAIQESANAYNYFKQQIAAAAQANDGMGIADATEKMILAQRRYEDLNKVKTGYQQNKNNRQAPLDPRLVNNAQSWLEKNKWYDPNGGDERSKEALRIDRALSSEGWDATTPQYWEELSARTRRLTQQTNSGIRTKSVVSGSGRESAPSGNGTYKLSADRVAAIKDSGKWDDPKERAAMISAYKQYDKEQRSNA